MTVVESRRGAVPPGNGVPPPGTPTRLPLNLRRELVGGHAGTAAAVACLTVLSVAGTLALPLVVGSMIDAVQRGASLHGPAVLLVAVGLGAAVTGSLSTFLVSRLGERLIHRLRVRVIDHTLRMRTADVEDIGVGDLAGRLGADAMTLKAAVNAVPVQLPTAVLSFAGTIVIMAVVDPVLLVVTLAGFASAVAMVTAVIIALKARYRTLQNDLGALTQRYVAAVEALTVIKSTRSEAAQSAELHVATDRLRSTGVNAARLEALVTPTVNLGQQIALIAVLIGGGARLVGGELTLGAFVGFLLYLLQLTAPLMMAASAMSTIQAGLTARSRFDSVLLAPLESDDTAERVTPDVTATIAELRDVRVGYGGEPVLAGVSLSVPAVGLTSIVGPSGSGKTTVLRLLERLIVADSGSVRVRDVDVRHQDLDGLRSTIAYVDQRCTLVPASVRDNLELGITGTRDDAELFAALARVGLDAEVRAMPDGLETVLGGGRNLSGGQAQRLALARAVLSDAPLVILDEPTSALDAANENRLRELMSEIARDRAVLVVAHRISTVREAAHVIVMDQGLVRAEGTHHELLGRCDLYSELVDMQMIRVGGVGGHPRPWSTVLVAERPMPATAAADRLVP